MEASYISIITNFFSGIAGVFATLFYNYKKDKKADTKREKAKLERLRFELLSNIKRLEDFQSDLNTFRTKMVVENDYNHYQFFNTSAIFTAMINGMINSGDMYDYLSDEEIITLHSFIQDCVNSEGIINQHFSGYRNALLNPQQNMALSSASIGGGYQTFPDTHNQIKTQITQEVHFWDQRFMHHKNKLNIVLQKTQQKLNA